MLNLREFYKLLPDVDSEGMLLRGRVGVPEGRVCAGELAGDVGRGDEEEVRDAHPHIGGRRVYPPGKVDVDTLKTKEEIVRAFWELTYVPREVYRPLSAVRTCCGRSRPGTSGRIRVWLVSICGWRVVLVWTCL